MMNSQDYLAGLVAMITHDIYKSNSISPEDISTIVKADVHIIISTQDQLVNPASSIDFSRELGCGLTKLTGDYGHIAVWSEADKVRK